MTRDELLTFVRGHRWAAVATVSPLGHPQVAVVRFVVTDEFELVFDTTEATRKTTNLRHNPGVAIAIGWDESQTIQIEGSTDEPSGLELQRLKELYSQHYPDFYHARRGAKGLIYFRVRPTWMCYSDFRQNPATIVRRHVVTGETTRTLEPFLGDGAGDHPERKS
jgi:hypothetical protein